MKKILLIACGGREHAIFNALRKSSHQTEIHIYGTYKNPALFQEADKYEICDISNCDAVIELAAKSAAERKFDFAIIGPELPIERGLSDELEKIGIATVAPSRATAKLEWSKSFTRELVSKYEIGGNPFFKRCESESDIDEFIAQGFEFVVKADGLKGGKGVSVQGDHFQSATDGREIALLHLKEDSAVVLEEKLVGEEFSFMSFSDGKTCVNMPAAQDHKRAFDSDLGPNTGGMGSYSCADFSLPFLTQDDLAAASQINEKVIEAIYKETGEYYKGVLYGGFMVTKNGVRLIEYNCRFGDPEAMNVLPILESDFVELCLAIVEQKLHEFEVRFTPLYTVCKYLVPNGYPENPVKNAEIKINKEAYAKAQIHFSSVNSEDDKFVMLGSRALGIVGKGASLQAAYDSCEAAIAEISGDFFYRKDIASSEALQKKIEFMSEVRG
jgi:fusion protein PurCD